MCLGIPAQIIEVDQNLMGKVQISGVLRRVSLQLIENPTVGEWVLIHAGYAINRIDEEEAKKTLELFEQLDAIQSEI